MSDLLDAFFSEFDVLTRSSMSNFSPLSNAKIDYPVDIYQTEENDLIIEFASVGSKKDDFEILVDNNRLRIIRKEKEKESQKKKWIVRKISRRDLDVSYLIDTYKFDLDGVTAECDDGLLKIKVPRLSKTNQKIIKIS